MSRSASEAALSGGLSFEDAASPISHLLLSYLSPLFRIGSVRPLQHEDLGCLSRQDVCSNQYDKFSKAWLEHTPDRIVGWKLGRVLVRAFGVHRFLLAMAAYLLMAAIQFGPVLILNALVSHFDGGTELSTELLWCLICLIAVLPVIASLCSARHTVIMSHLGLSIRNSLIAAIYRKSLKISVGSRKVSSTGKIVNMFSADTQQLERLMTVFALIFIAPLQIMVALYLIYQQVGVATFVGLGVMVLFAPISAVIFGMLSMLRRRASVVTDSRVKLMSEILSGIRLVKYFAWEVPFKEKIVEIRKSEIAILRKIAIVIALGFSMIMLSLPLIQPVLVFYTYVKLGNTLNSAKAFTTLALFSIIRFPFAFLPMGLAQVAQSRIAAERILSFLLTSTEIVLPVNLNTDDAQCRILIARGVNETASRVMAEDLKTQGETDIAVKFVNAEASWDAAVRNNVERTEESNDGAGPSRTGTYVAVEKEEVEMVEKSTWALKDINLTIKKGELVAVVGPVGSGKTAFLNLILGEMELTSGCIFSSGTMSYCDQRPWIMNATLKENILFGLPYDENKFDIAVSSVSLDEDINLLPGGVLTEIGERGINLSGGQKARVALARALYRGASLALLDDPLSAVDAYVGRELFNECIVKAMTETTRILVTHQVHLLTQADRVLVFDNGTIVANGTHDELLAAGVDLMHYVPSDSTTDAVSPEEKVSVSSDSSKKFPLDDILVKKNAASTLRKQDSRSSAIVSKEEKAEGSVSFMAYDYYIKSGGYIWFFLLILVTAGAKGFDVGSQFYLALWNSKSTNAEEKNEPLSSSENLAYLNFYAMLLMLGVASFVIRSLAGAVHRLQAASIIHKDILDNILKVPISFFDITPIGRILNRFSSDMATVDFEIGPTVIQYLNCMISVLGSVTAIAVSTKGALLILMLPLMLLFYTWKNYFLKSNTELKRLINISRSPIYADFSTALSGIATIRAFGDEPRFIRGMEEKVNINTRPSMLSYSAVQWLSIRLDCNGALVSFFIAAVTAATIKYDFIPPGYLGLALSISFEMTLYLRQAVNMAAQFEAQMNSVERIRHYTFNVAEESDIMSSSMEDKSHAEVTEIHEGGIVLREDIAITSSEAHTDNGIGGVIPPADWPQEGAISITGLRMRYRNGPEVLKGVTFDVAGGSKVGIVGRTGSGKSSLMVSIFRIENYTPHNAIIIDGIDISKVPLSILRSRLNIIPQDPVLFSASLRFNLDPFGQASDQQIWDVLESVTLKDFVQSLPNKLDEMVSEGGDNFSSGQRQIFCIARVLLKNPKIVVLDEATSAIDNTTDEVIQAMIRQRFATSTVLTIAHRLHTIIDADKILVMDNGQIAEMGTAEELNKNDNGIFHCLWQRQTDASA